MNCANHADASAVAYCRTCGKALCANCTRPVRGVIYCEDCLGAKMEGVPTGSSAGSSGFAAGGFSSTVGAPATMGAPAAFGQIPRPAAPYQRQRTEPDSGWNSGWIFSLRRGRRIHRAICQGAGAPLYLRFTDRRD